MEDRAGVELMSVYLGLGRRVPSLARVTIGCCGGCAIVCGAVVGCEDDAAWSALPCGGVEAGSTCMGLTCMGEGIAVGVTRSDSARATEACGRGVACRARGGWDHSKEAR